MIIELKKIKKIIEFMESRKLSIQEKKKNY